MLVKVVVLFLVAMVALAMVGRLRLPGGRRPAAATCPTCGRPQIGKGRCPCKQG